LTESKNVSMTQIPIWKKTGNEKRIHGKPGIGGEREK